MSLSISKHPSSERAVLKSGLFPCDSRNRSTTAALHLPTLLLLLIAVILGIAVKSSPGEIKIVQMSRGVPTGPEQRANKIPRWMSVTALWWLEQRFDRRGVAVWRRGAGVVFLQERYLSAGFWGCFSPTARITLVSLSINSHHKCK